MTCGATDGLVARWLRAVRQNVYNFALWEATAERHQEHKALVGETPLLARRVTAATPLDPRWPRPARRRAGSPPGKRGAMR